jgi:hypothetical protein
MKALFIPEVAGAGDSVVTLKFADNYFDWFNLLALFAKADNRDLIGHAHLDMRRE